LALKIPSGIVLLLAIPPDPITLHLIFLAMITSFLLDSRFAGFLHLLRIGLYYLGQRVAYLFAIFFGIGWKCETSKSMALVFTSGCGDIAYPQRRILTVL